MKEVEKYRPDSLNDVYGQSDIVDTGTGKTSTIIALAKEIYGSNYKNMVLELNASDDRGIDVVRNQIKNFASTMQIFSKGYKLIILDEADAMTNVAQNALRRIIEKYTKNTRFCILANYAHKLNPALLSRCTRFRFSPLTESSIKENIAKVIIKENLKISSEAEAALLKLSKGDMRKALNVLQACKAAVDEGEEISEDMIYESVGAPHPKDIETILDSILKDDWSSSIATLQKIKQLKGLALIDLLQGFIEILDQYELKTRTRAEILKGLGEIEYAISKGGNEKIQSSASIGVIKKSLEFEVV
ncbi:unnamed protein product [Wickerhamomyces anomalus]